MGYSQPLEAEAPTREVTRLPARSQSARRTPVSTASLRVTADALQAEEMGRVRMTARVLMFVVGAGSVMLPFLGGDPLARHVMIGGLAVAMCTLLLVHQLASSTAAYDVDRVGALCVTLAFTLGTAVYFFGIFSAAPMLGGLGLYIFCLGSSTRWSVAMFIALAGVHAALASLVLSGAIADRGLIRGADLSFSEQVVVQLCVLCIYAIAFGAGRASRAKLVDAVQEMEAAVRRLTERDAQLSEARRELVRAAGAGGEGRFTDQVLGDYRLGNIIGRGGMGEVYEAQHVESGAEAAVKLLQRSAFGEPDSLARFIREARAAAALRSEYVVKVLDIPSEDAPVPYLTMERLRGEDLGSLLRREKRLSHADTLTLVRQVGAALDAARRVGVIHRDLKPQNLFLARTAGAPVWKVLDFGVSKLADQATLTRDKLIGTPEYMPPEQAQGKRVDHRADLYALAAVSYRCLTGRPPFHGGDLPAVVYRVVHSRPLRPSKAGPVSSQVDDVLSIGMAPDREDRFTSGAAFAHAMEAALTGQLSPAVRAHARALEQRAPWREEP